MKQISSWLCQSLTVLTIAAIAHVNPANASEVNPAIIANSSQEEMESIDIYVPPPESSYKKMCPEFLEPEITGIINKYKGKWGILVQTLDDDRNTLYQYNANQLLIPASNAKILTTAAALQKLDPSTPIKSKSLSDWIKVTNLRSNNFYADTLMRFIGGYSAAKQALTQLGVESNGYRLADGSGLSRRNLATPTALVQALRGIYYAQNRDTFYTSLPVAGISGTLEKRLRQTTAEGIVHAKTGTLTGVRALSGYIDHPEYGMLVFSILVNQPKVSGTSLVKAVDDIVLRISQLSRCEPPMETDAGSDREAYARNR